VFTLDIDQAGATTQIWANLDIEAQWGGAKLKTHVLRRISAASALLVALAPPGPVEIFAPVAVDPRRIKISDLKMRVGAPQRFDLAWADPSAKAVNDRRFALSLRDELGVALAGARVIESLDELDAHIETTGARRWVCKAPWTAAGRDRAHGVRKGGDHVYIARLLERCGALVFEPWLERIVDLGVAASVVRDGTVQLHGIHTLRVDPRGMFVGIDLAAPQLTDDESSRMMFVARSVARHLALAGYVGPFTIDAFVYRDEHGERALHPISEINARYTFGHVALGFAQRFGTQTLGFGAPPEGAQVLVEAGEHDPVTAWVA